MVTSFPMQKQLTYPEIFRFFLPLVLNAQMMFLSMPIINLGLSRTAKPEIAIAAYSVGFYFLALLASPAICSRNVSTAFLTDRQSFLFIRRLFFLCGLFVTITALLIALTPLYRVVFLHIYGIPATLVEEVRRVLLITAPVGMVIAMRGVYQGVALVHKKPVIMAYATLVRLVAIAIIVFVAIVYLKLPGASGGAISIVSGMSIEAVFVYLQVRGFFRSLPSEKDASSEDRELLRLSQVLRFMAPLLVGMIVLTFLPTLINGILSRISQPEMALAGFGVLYPILRFFTSPLLGFQVTTLVLFKSLGDLRKLTICVLGVSAVFSGMLFAIGYTPVGLYLLTDLFALDPELVAYATPALFILFIFPVVTGIRNHTQGILMNLKATVAISVSAVSKALLLLGLGLLLISIFADINGVVLGIVLITLGEFCDDLFLGGAALQKIRQR
ncbi:hypothetical protein GF339_17180 [candidate division KSB3 bacterium]|uniref:Uncharacterized protein n=1 Tax=candidate division KSB3 bacterium TaxID=2044937 RepID=A0A9D5JYY2_9BACT|nr:hypothetical protein [candidate division KSB3 bacterium]MBD3326321.1 hypothetical protein [candidate division KSB3 bacterium]